MDENSVFRVDRILGMTGVPRNEAKKWIAAGRVAVNGATTRDPGAKARPDQVTLDGRPVGAEPEVYVMIHKPQGVVTATEDKKFPTVADLLPEKYQKRKIGPVGRLDRDVTGLVIMTTDGELAHRLISPKWKAEKTYRAVCEGRLDQQTVDAFAQGMRLSDFTAQPARLEILAADDQSSTALVTLTEGKFHQVKRMFAACGHPLTALSRIRIGCVHLDEALAPGESRALTRDEIDGLKALTGLK